MLTLTTLCFIEVVDVNFECQHIGTRVMRTSAIFLILPLLATVAGCKQEAMQTPPRPIRSIIAVPKPVQDDPQAVGEMKPRYESDLSFRVGGKLLARRVDVGATVKQG